MLLKRPSQQPHRQKTAISNFWLHNSNAAVAGIISLSAKAGFLHQVGCHHLVVLQKCGCIHGSQLAICHNHPAIDDCISGFAGAAKYQSGERIPGGTGKINPRQSKATISAA